jgi:glycosyltransferase 2 family protein
VLDQPPSKPDIDAQLPNTTYKSLTRRLIPGILFGILVFITIILVGDIHQVSQQALKFRWVLFPVVILLTLFNYTLRFGKFHYYLEIIGVQNMNLKERARIFIAGFPLAVTPGKVGEALKGVWIYQSGNVTTARGISVVVAERISDGLAVLVLSLLGVIAFPQYWPAFIAILALLFGIVIISQIRPLAGFLLCQGERLPVVGRFAHSMREFYEGSYSLFRPIPLLFAVGLGTISWLGEGFGFYLILLGLGIPGSYETLSIAVFILAFSTLIGALSSLPGGIGAAEASIASMLVILLGLDSDVAATATLLIRFATLWFGVSLGLAVWAFSPNLLGIMPISKQK